MRTIGTEEANFLRDKAHAICREGIKSIITEFRTDGAENVNVDPLMETLIVYAGRVIVIELMCQGKTQEEAFKELREIAAHALDGVEATM